MSYRYPYFCLLAPLILAAALGTILPPELHGRDKEPPVDPNNPTYRLFQLLDTTRGGKVTDFFVLADVYRDPANPDQELQRILRVEYDKTRFFGRFRIAVRSVARLTPEQLKTYTLQQVYDFGNSDQEKFDKMEPGPFGQKGDLYLRAEGERPPASAPITEEVKKAYDLYLTQYLLPAFQKK